MGCGLSKQDEEDDVVSLCRERKRLLKLAAEKRYAFADAQFKYNQSLYAVALALRLFVARHSSHSSPFLITFPSNTNLDETLPGNPFFLHQTPTEPIHETIACSGKVEETHECKEEKEEEEEETGESEDGEVLCQHFYGEEEDVVGPVEPSPQRQVDYGWDFFYPFDDMRTPEILNGFNGQSYDEGLEAVIRKKEGIPELEEDGEKLVQNEKKIFDVGNKNDNQENGIEDLKNGDNANVDEDERKGLKVIDTPKDGRELLEALKDIEDHFLRAYDSGLDISRMLEANRVHLQSGLEEIKETSNKLIRSITGSRSSLSRSSSSKSLLSSSSANSSMWPELKTDVFDDFGMEAGSHSLTLSRLYAWEKKLYQEVKIGDETRKLFERKCTRLRRLDSKGDDFCSMDKSKAEMKELHSRISVAMRSVESISNRIEKLRDEELQPQLLELLHGLIRNWKIMLESHETQKRVMLEVKYFNSPAFGKFSNDSHRLATLQLEAEIDNWRICFAAYLSSQKAYIESLTGWLSKFIAPELPYRFNGPPLLLICNGWLAWLDKLPNKAVIFTMKSFAKDIHSLWSQQGKEQQQKRKVDGLAKELDRRALAFQKAERRILSSKISDQEPEASARQQIEYLAEGKQLLDAFKNRLEEEKGKHLNSIQETQQITVSGFQTGFSSVFESLVEFSNASVKMFADLVTYTAKNTKEAEKIDSNLSYMDGMFS